MVSLTVTYSLAYSNMPSNAAVTALVALFNATGGPTNWTRRDGWGHGDPCGGSNASNSNSNSNVPEQEQQPDPLDTDWYKYEEVKLLAANGVGGQQGQQWYGICCQDTAIDATGLPTCEGLSFPQQHIYFYVYWLLHTA